MTKKYLSFLLLSALLVSLLSGCTSDNIKSENTISQEALPDASSQDIENLIDVTLNEVAHSIFYAPMYVAIENDYFAEEGINLEIVCGFGADKVMTAVLSGEADIGFMGPESSIYTFNEGANDYVINFAQLTQRAGNFLVSREKITDFSWDDLKGSYVLGGRKGVVHQSM